jgi:hypothetical protein
MRSGSSWLWLCIAALSACNGAGAAPCIGGSYAMGFNAIQTSQSAGCTTLGIGLPEGALVLTQQAASLSADYSGFVLQGTLLETYNLSLSGFGADGGSMSLNALYVPSELDAGASLQGSLTAQYLGTSASGASCSQNVPFTAVPQ